MRLNTGISAMMIFLNLAIKKGKVTKETVNTFAKILSPFAPHLAEELWQQQGHDKTLVYEPWPLVNEEYLKEDTFEYPVSFNGKLRFKIELPVTMGKDEVAGIVLADERAKKWLSTGTLANIIVVPNRIVNIVVK
jgi:leucyl-tRNA synthetase